MNRVQDEKGSALLLNLLAVAVFAIMAVVVYSGAKTQVSTVIWTLRQAQALAIAEAGLEDALQTLRRDSEWRTGFTNKPFAGGTYTVTLSSATLPVIASTGYSSPIFLIGSAVKTVTVTTQLTPGQCFYAIGADRVTVEGVVDRYDPTVSLTPSATMFFTGADVFSNNNVDASGTCDDRIRGDSYAVGTNANPCYVEGNVYTTTNTITLPTYPCSDCDTVNLNATGISPSSAYNSSSKQLVVNNETVTLTGPGRFYFKKVTVKNNGILNIDTSSGTVSLWLDGNWDTTAPCQVNNMSKIAPRLRFYDLANAGHSVPFNCSTPLHAYIEGVWAQAYIQQEFYGHFCADRVTVESTGKVHWDGDSIARAGWTVGLSGSWTETYRRQ